MTHPIEIEGTLQQIITEGSQYSGHQMRLTILPDVVETAPIIRNGLALEEAQASDLPGLIPARRGSHPIQGLDAFMASLPQFEQGEVQDLWDAIEEDRTERRAVARGVEDVFRFDNQGAPTAIAPSEPLQT